MMVTPDVSFKHVGVHHPIEDDRKKAAVNCVARLGRRNWAHRPEHHFSVIDLPPALLLREARDAHVRMEVPASDAEGDPSVEILRRGVATSGEDETIDVPSRFFL